MILDDIAFTTRKRIEAKKKEIPFEKIKEKAMELAKAEAEFTFPFEQAIAKSDISFICEIKRASPSKGLIVKEFPYLEIATEYEKAGADCISVLTEPEYFKGNDSYLKKISQKVSIPTIRKDFLIDEYMIYEAKVLGASCVLLIVALLDESTIKRYIEICDKLGLSTLVEVHNEKEITSAMNAKARLIGVNNRDLRDFTVDIQNSIRLRDKIPSDILFVAESGIKTAEDVQTLHEHRVNGVLIGETLMRSLDKRAMLAELRGEARAREGS
ncbi:MAG: indole-3-glycerol phosphate synthase TrpC [Lachnospiraceae bacterium]|nr:indole-3-glycerol phosphate synthase TrpC [Lachnospiraceae bacterium]